MVCVVAVSQRVNVLPERRESQDALDQRMTAWLVAAGFLPLPVPNTLSVHSLEQWLTAFQPHAIVLSGGNDIGSKPERDRTESFLLNWSKTHQLPTLGICRGMQMMGVWAGSSLKTVEGHVAVSHAVEGEISGMKNSFHHFSLASCPLGFNVLATTKAGDIEAMKHRELPWEGWMWHPERESSFAADDLARVQTLFNRSA